MAIAQVNTGSGINLASGGSIATAATSLTTGNFIVVAVLGGNVTFAVTDTAGNTYTSIARQVTAGGSALELFYCTNVTGNGSNIVTATYTPNTSSRVIGTVQYSGVGTVVPVRASATKTEDIGPTSIALTTVMASYNSLVIAAGSVEATGGTWTPGTGLTSAVQDSSTVTIIAENITGASLTNVTPSLSSSSNQRKNLIGAIFIAQPAASGGAAAYAYA